MYNAKAYSAASATSPLASTTIARRVSKLEAHVSETAQADDTDFFALADSPMMHR